MWQVVVLFLATRAALLVTVLAAVAYVQPAGCPICVDISANPLLGALAHWDAEAYVDVARGGYEGAGRATNAAYSPLFPLLMRAVGTLFGGGTDALIVGGVLVANAALVVGVVALARLAATRVDDSSAMRSAAYVLVFPTTIFLSAPYAESLFIALAVLSALEAQRARLWRSGTYAALAALTRPFGALALLPLAFAAWRARRTGGIAALAPVALAPLAFFGWSAYLWAISGDPLQVVHVYAAWGSAPRSPLGAITDLFDPTVYGFPWVVLGLFALFVGLAAASWRVVGPEFGAYATAMLLVVASSGSLTSSMRYELAIFPAFIVLGVVTRRAAIRLIWVAASTALALILAAMYALQFWIG